MEELTLHNFILEFLSTSERFRRTTNNSAQRITKILNSVFVKFFGIKNNVEVDTIIKAFTDLKYRIFDNDKEIDAYCGGLSGKNVIFSPVIYINADTQKLRCLLLTTWETLPDNTDIKKIEDVINTKDRLKKFGSRLKDRNGERNTNLPQNN